MLRIVLKYINSCLYFFRRNKRTQVRAPSTGKHKALTYRVQSKFSSHPSIPNLKVEQKLYKDPRMKNGAPIKSLNLKVPAINPAPLMICVVASISAQNFSFSSPSKNQIEFPKSQRVPTPMSIIDPPSVMVYCQVQGSFNNFIILHFQNLQNELI